VSKAVEGELASRLMARDEKALRETMNLYGGFVYAMAKRVLAEPTLAEEVAQDSFLALWRRPGAFDPERGSLKTFLVSIARNKAIDLVRREEASRRVKDSLMQELEVSQSNTGFEEQVGKRTDLTDALAQLSAVQREAIVLAYFGGRTYREVASELGIAEGTAKTRLRDGLLRLRSGLSQSRKEIDGE
jgi:RNA polymerase sigma-70 factor, ECF subfamily